MRPTTSPRPTPSTTAPASLGTPSRPGTPTRRRNRSLGVAAVAVALVTAGCGAGADGQDDEALDATAAQLSRGPDPNGLLGLEVTATGDVSEVLDVNAFRMDKDGTDRGVDAPGGDPTAGDEEFDLGVAQEDVLVIVPRADLDLTTGTAVRVSGTVRSLDAEAVEEVYDVEIDTDEYAPYLDQLVLVADTVTATS